MKLSEITKRLIQIRNDIRKYAGTPSRLADLAVEAATYNADLGDYLGKYQATYEQQRGEAYIGLTKDGASGTQAENLTRSQLSDLRGKIKQLEVFHKDVEKIISTIQTKVRSLETEAKNQI
jgi:hypothetical protein